MACPYNFYNFQNKNRKLALTLPLLGGAEVFVPLDGVYRGQTGGLLRFSLQILQRTLEKVAVSDLQSPVMHTNQRDMGCSKECSPQKLDMIQIQHSNLEANITRYYQLHKN